MKTLKKAALASMFLAALGCAPVNELDPDTSGDGIAAGARAAAFDGSGFEPSATKLLAVFPASADTFKAIGIQQWMLSSFASGIMLEARVASHPNCGVNCGTDAVSRLMVGKQRVPSGVGAEATTADLSVVEWHSPGAAGRLAIGTDKAIVDNTLPPPSRPWTAAAIGDLKRATLPNLPLYAWGQLSSMQDALISTSMCSGDNKAPACIDVGAKAVAQLVQADPIKGSSLVKFTNHPLKPELNKATLTITDLVTGSKHTYPNLFGTLCVAQISGVANMNGIPGDEVLVTAGCGGNIQMFAVDDRSQRIYHWDIPHGARVSFSIGDTDVDHPGAEVLAIMNPMTGSESVLYSSKLDPDSNRVLVQSAPVPGMNARLLGVANLDGSPASSLAFLSGDKVHHLRDSRTGPYLRWTSVLASSFVSAFEPADTDGAPGKEVVVRYNSGAIAIVDFAKQTQRSYPSASGALGIPFKNRDGLDGVDLCLRSPDGSARLLVDRAQRIDRVTQGCT
ncbi:MAG: hypothetical protein U0235_07495 [Polyangiaceae bacterium]